MDGKLTGRKRLFGCICHSPSLFTGLPTQSLISHPSHMAKPSPTNPQPHAGSLTQPPHLLPQRSQLLHLVCHRPDFRQLPLRLCVLLSLHAADQSNEAGEHSSANWAVQSSLRVRLSRHAAGGWGQTNMRHVQKERCKAACVYSSSSMLQVDGGKRGMFSKKGGAKEPAYSSVFMLHT